MQIRDILTPQALAMLQTVAQEGSLAAAARQLGLVPSALSYRVRQIEETLDVLLFDRSGRKATLTDAGRELISEGSRLLAELDAVANRVQRVATGWEPHLTIALESLIDETTVLELCEAFLSLKPPTQLKLRTETLNGTWEALAYGEADLALGVGADHLGTAGIQSRPLGEVPFVFAVAPHHPLASIADPLPDRLIAQHRAVALADSATRLGALTVGLLGGQRVITVPTLQLKLQAQLRGLGCGFLPLCLAQPYAQAGRLVVKRTERPERAPRVAYAWAGATRARPQGKALAWWLKQLESPVVRRALLHGDDRRA